MDISVIIPTYNRARAILTAVESVLKQKGPSFELIIVDDGSTDDTSTILAPFKDSLKYLRLAENKGVSRARNLGINQAIGDYICFLDSDDEFLEGKLASQKEFMDKNQELLFSQGQEIWVRNGRQVNPGTRHLKRAGLIFEPSLELCLISPSAVIMRREFFDKIGLFDEELLACEDYDLWLRALLYHPVGLLDKYVTIRYGGLGDQLSQRHSLDKYRILSLEKLLSYPNLNSNYRKAIQRTLEKKRAIYQKGLAKRMG
ncbi:MAG: glycosyltransferase [Deltaproteobacteria bacterium]|jgi:glycosyltransferase involved in cell wall biosynthesis|nr:glycosyltransferase [Deltaproteobacteria bacterium]